MEIEVKARVRDRDVLTQELAKRGCVLAEPKTQDDMVWARTVGSLEEFLSNETFLRIRIQNGSKFILTAKSAKAKTGDESLVKREHEVEVSSAEEARNILELLGLKEVVRVIKTRRTTHYQQFEICLDDIEGLGLFIEIEQMGDENDAPRIQTEMFALLKELGIGPEDYVNKGYDILMLEQMI